MYQETLDQATDSPDAPMWVPAPIDRLMDALDALQQHPESEQRRSERRSCRRTAVFVAVEGHTAANGSHLVHVRNISAGGVCFLDKANLSFGARCRVDMRVTRTEWIRCRGHVVRSRSVGPEKYEAAVVFDKSLLPEELERICGPQS